MLQRAFFKPLIALAVLCTCGSAVAEIHLDQSTKAQLEGIWLLDAKPNRGACAKGAYLNYQIEFDFGKSGGRFVNFVPPDLIVGVPILSAARRGDIVELYYTDKYGKPDGLLRFRFQDRETMQVLAPVRNTVASPDFPNPGFAFRCGEPDRSVTGSIPAKTLALLTPLTTASGQIPRGPGFVEQLPGVSDEEICRPKVMPKSPPHWLIFELFGPVHYYVLGEPINGKRFDLAPIRSASVLAPNKLKLEVVQRDGREWGPYAEGDITTLTVAFRGSHITIPELNMTFVRCSQAGPLDNW